ncbi:MAG TPA: hypothetical protein ENN67_04565 [Firmicutes bacterium]|nr:hypothetical protein [Bacillota bacterium]
MQEFDGTLIFVSHDRAFIDRLASHTMELSDGKAVVYHGNYTDVIYRQHEIKRRVEENERRSRRDELDEERREKARIKRRKGVKSDEKPLSPYKLMDEIELLEAKIDALEEELSQPEVYSDYEKSRELTGILKGMKTNRDELFKRLEETIDD